MSNVCVSSVEAPTLSTSTSADGFAHKPALMHIARGECGLSPVYNLTVETDNEYYANGVLVHNCDSLQYIAMGLLLVMSTGDDDVSQYETEIEWC